MTATQVDAARNASAPHQRASGGLKITALATGFVMATLDVTVVNVAGATIQERMHTSLTQLTWIVDGYVLTFASLLMLAGVLANKVGPKTIYMWGMAVFFVASLGCALSSDPGILIAARLVQGAGAALFMPSSLSLLVFSFPDKRKRTRMLGLWSAIVATSSGLGPTIGGLMVSAFGWQSVFLLNLPIGAIGMVMTYRFIAPIQGRTSRLAVPGHITWIIALAAASFALIEGPQLGWTAAPVLASYLVAAAAAALVAGRERSAENPVMPWALFRSPGFRGANVVGFLFNFALFGSVFMLGLYLQHARGASAFQAGLELLPMTIFFPLANVVYSRISARFSNGLLLTTFLLVAGVASLTMITVSASTPYWALALAVGIANIGAGIISPGMTAALVDAAGPEHANTAGSVLNSNRQIGSLVGIAAVGIVLHSTPDWNHGAALSFLVVAIAYLAGALAAWRLVARPENSTARTATTA
ncbi:DHA2 family methylenomycin A resistance protein-like MFS transporter [Streptomyces sp. 846.5]|nr:MFS transporter [Streptomyces sp. 846.5]TDU01686.1 DHA2 family methylenomycin A resistance protein-like MFS transporter [Streptomyces sp. 846.5]